VCLLPLALAIVFVWYTPLGHHPFSFEDTWMQRDGDYRTVLLTSYSDHFAPSRDEFWAAISRGTKRQARLLSWYFILVGLEALTHTLDRDGKLMGIYLNNAERYDRPGLLSDRKNGVTKPTADYWKIIPGRRLFIFADKLYTLNLRPQTTLAAAEELALQLDPN